MNQDDRLGPYRLLRPLGEGGMGVVHLALDPQGRQVAVKVLRPEVAGDDVARRRLSREVETMRRVRGPHIAEVVDADVTGRRPYIVTRYVPGRSLDEIVKRDGPLPFDALLKVALGVAEALATVHAAGVVHRDLKPGNVLMLDDRPVLIDFGIAQAVDATRLTQTGMFIGTPGYLAPEIIEGQEAGPQADVHAWAGTVLFAATGQPPFGRGTLEMIFFNITSGRANWAAAPPPLQPVLRAALHRDPAKRPTAAEIVDWIRRLQPQAGRPRVPDEITTVPNINDPNGRPAPGLGGSVPARPTGPMAPPTAPTASPTAPSAVPPTTSPTAPATTPPAMPPTAPPRPVTGGHAAGGTAGQGAGQGTGQGAPGDPLTTPRVVRPPVARPPAEEYVSLLGDRPADGGGDQPGDPYPTVRVTGEDLRRAGLGSAGVIQRDGAPRHAGGGEGARPHAEPSEGEMPPTRRITPEELRQAVPQAFFDRAPEAFERTPQVQQAPPAPFLPTIRVPPPVAPPPVAPLLQRSKAYDVAAALLLVLMTGLAVIAPVLMCVLALPVAVLLRAADLAQPWLTSRRAAGAAATDVIRVLSRPAEIVKSVGVTIALLPYAAVLGLPVTLLLTVLIPMVPVSAALSWGIAVALWTVCAGPGVEGPNRQMRRTLVSLVPGAAEARTMAWGIGAVAAVVGLIALASLAGAHTAGHFWGPVDVSSVMERLSELRDQAGSQ